VDGHDRVATVVRAGEDQLELQVGELRLDGGQLGLDFGQGVGVVGLLGQLQEDLGVGDPLLQLDPRRDLVAEAGQLFQRGLGGLGVIPEVGRGRPLFEAPDLLLLGSEVKDAPGGRPPGRGDR
jgi:hypothetical protein